MILFNYNVNPSLDRLISKGIIHAMVYILIIQSDAIVTLPPPEFDNCIPLHETLQLSWRVDNDTASVRFRLCGCHSNGSE